MSTIFAASPDGLERGQLERLLAGYLRAWPEGEHPLLRLATTRDLDALYAQVAECLETLGAAEGGPDIELVPGDLLACTSTGDYVVTEDLELAARLGGRGRRPVQTFAPPAREETATERVRALLGWFGIAWASLPRSPSGYGDEARMFLRALDDAGLEPVAYDLQARHPSADLSVETERMIRRAEARQLPETGYLRVLHHIPMPHLPQGSFEVCRTMFETASVPADWVPFLQGMHRVWVPSEFNVESFARGGVDPERLRVLPGTVDFTRFRPDAPPRDLGAFDGFTFVSNFDFHDRKGWDVLLRAYALEFAGVEDVRLVLKVALFHTPLEKIRARVAAELDRLGLPASRLPRVEFLPDMIPEAELPGLYTAADAYVSPTRGEGWGRPLMEALACGVPVVASRWSGQLAFLDDTNAWLIDGEVVDVPADVDVAIFRGQRWFEPDLDATRAAMRAVYADPAAARARARGARPALVERFSLAAIAERIAELTLEAM